MTGHSEFFLTPWTHWPETQITYLQEEKILFPCDLFGFHMATSELYVTDEAEAYRSAKRYYAEIMMPFRNSIKGYVEKVRGLHLDHDRAEPRPDPPQSAVHS